MARAILVAVAAATAAAAMPTVTLYPNVAAPVVQLGTGGGGVHNMSLWLDAGGRGVDTASTYCYNPAPPLCSQVDIATAVWDAVASGQLSNRSDAFIMSKIEPEDFGELGPVANTVKNTVLNILSTTYVDVLMMHQSGRHATDTNPRPPCWDANGNVTGDGTYAACRVQTWQAFIELRKQGVARAVGVSNWNVRDLLQAFAATGEYPAVNEIEFHPYWHEDDTLNFCVANNIAVIAYAPLAVPPRTTLLQEPAVLAAAAAHGVSPAQIVLKYGLTKGASIVIPRSHNSTHMAANMDLWSFALTPAEMASMDSYEQKKIFNTVCQPWC